MPAVDRKPRMPANAIHAPHSRGTLCGLVGKKAPTDPRSYSTKAANVTCPFCAEMLDDVADLGRAQAQERLMGDRELAGDDAPEPKSLPKGTGKGLLIR